MTLALSPPDIQFISGDEVAKQLSVRAATQAVEEALRAGLDPDADAPRSSIPTARGHFLLMPSEFKRYCGVKVASVAPDNPSEGRPRINGSYLLFDAHTLAPLALLDGIALTSLRTPAVSAVAVDQLARADAHRLLLFGTGPQAWNHIEAIKSVRPITEVIVVARSTRSAQDFTARYAAFDPSIDIGIGRAEDVRHADIVACCTSSAEPLFDGTLLTDDSTVVAIGSHEPDRREVDDVTIARSLVFVESVATATSEAGDIVIANNNGVLDVSTLISLADLLCANLRCVAADRPRFFKSVGMAWEDLVVAAAVYEKLRPTRLSPAS